MSDQKLEWSVVTTVLVVRMRFEESGSEGKRLILRLQQPTFRHLELRLTKDNFRYLLRKMKPENQLREVFTEADGQELYRWIWRKYIKVRVRKFVNTKRVEIEFIDFVE